MGVTLSGFNSGLPVNDIISQLMAVERRPIDLLQQRKAGFQAEQSRYNDVKTKVDSLLASIKAITTTSVGKSPFKAKLATYPTGFEDAYKAIATASAGETASPQTLTLKVLSKATATKAASQSGVGQTVTAGALTTSLAQGTLKAGSFTVFVNGQANTINVAKDGVETVDDVLQQIRDIGGGGVVDAQVVGNKLQMTFTGGTDVQLGSASDTSNFLKVTHLQTGTKTATDITGAADVLLINNTALLSDASANLATAVTDGTFSINGTEFDTTGKTLNQMITAINNTSAAGVTASFNFATNQLQLTAKNAGSSLINLQEGTGNFLSAMGLVNGADTTASQTAGSNASFELNGNLMYSASNTVDESISGIAGVTLTLQKADPATTITVNIKNNTDDIKTKVSDFISKYNAVISYIDLQTNAQNNGVLAGESSILRFRNTLRQMVSSAVSGLSGSKYQSLRDAGISTGAVNGTANAKPTLELDAAKLEAALADNPDIIRQLFAGKTATDGFDGAMTKIQSSLDSALLNDGTNKGMFAAYSDSITRRIKSLDTSIDKAEERLEKKQIMYQKQFQVMESLIGQYQSQGSAISGLLSQLQANK